MNRKRALAKVLTIVGLLLMFGLFGISQASEDYPTKPITGIVPHSPGGGTDMMARGISIVAPQYIGQPIIVVCKPGGGGQTGSYEVARSKPDGYTLLMGFGGGEHLVAPHLRKLPYDPMDAFEPIIMVTIYPSGLFVGADTPWNTLDEFIADAKKNPGKIKFSHPGTGSSNHMCAIMCQKLAGIELGDIPAAGGAKALHMILGGHVQAASIGATVGWPHVQAGKLKMLAYSLAERNEKFFPGAPTYKEQGYDIRVAPAKAIAAPKGTPKHIIEKLHDGFKKAMEDKSFIRMFQRMKLPVQYMDTETCAKYLRETYETNGKLIKQLGITLK